MTPAEQALILAALAYVNRNSEPFSKRTFEAWDALERAAGVVRKERER